MSKLSVAQLTAVLSAAAVMLAALAVSGAALVTKARSATDASEQVVLAQTGGAPGTGAPAMGTPPAGDLAAGAGAPAPAAPAAATATESGLPDLEPLSPLEPYRENPFVARPQAHDEGLVYLPRLGTYVTPADASIWGSIVRSNQEYFKANLDNNFGYRFSWDSTHFPRPRTVIQPSGAEPSLMLPQPPAAIIAMDAAPTGTQGTAVRPPDADGAAAPRSTVRTDSAVVRRVAAIIHNGTAVAIIEYEQDGALQRIQVRAGQEFVIGNVKYRVRAIGAADIVLVNVASNAELTVPLRGRAADE